MQTEAKRIVDAFPASKQGWATLPSATCHVWLGEAGQARGRSHFQASDFAFSHLNNLPRELI